MAKKTDLKERILQRYGVDIEQENLLKLYGIKDPELNDDVLEKAFEQRRSKWQRSVDNGTNDQIREKARDHLSKANHYERILRDSKLRLELFAYYNGEQSDGQGKGAEFAEQFFEVVSTSKRIGKADADFFYGYYEKSPESQDKRAIDALLKSKYKVDMGRGGKRGRSKEKVEDSASEAEPQEKGAQLPIKNLFSENTIMDIRRCEQKYAEAAADQDVRNKYALTGTLYEMLNEKLGLGKIESAEVLKGKAKELADTIFNAKQEAGGKRRTALDALWDTMNKLCRLCERQDVRDNFREFKLLLRYPKLNPYMYEFVNMEPKTLESFWGIANLEYVFRDKTDFLLSYLSPVHDNFNIQLAQATRKLLKEAQAKAAEYAKMDALDEKLGRQKSRRIPAMALVIYYLSYWPIFVMYFLLELVKLAIHFVQQHPIKFGIALLAVSALSVLIRAPFQASIRLPGSLMDWGFGAVALTVFLYLGSEKMVKEVDWGGYERTFKMILEKLRDKTERQVQQQPNKFYQDKMPKVIINNVVFIAAVVILAIICVL